jgi:hypothetical protein
VAPYDPLRRSPADAIIAVESTQLTSFAGIGIVCGMLEARGGWQKRATRSDDNAIP